MKPLISTIIFLSLLAVSCKKKKDEPDSDSHRNIHAIGYKVNMNSSPLPVPVYWQEGKEIVLGNENAIATSIKINNKEVYIMGYVNNKPVFWKNGLLHYLPFSGSTGASMYISFDKGDTYVTGIIDGEHTIWKNTIKHKVLPKYGNYKSVQCHQGDVHYLVQKNVSGNSVTEYWKNETVTEILPHNKVIEHMAFINEDVYLAGTNQKETEVSVWKNNVHTVIATATDSNKYQLQLEGICVDGTDVYVFYYEVDIINKTYVVRYWKNGSLYTLKTPDNFDPGFFQVIEGEIYYSGAYLDYTASISGAFYFVNDTKHSLNKEYYSGVQEIAVMK